MPNKKQKHLIFAVLFSIIIIDALGIGIIFPLLGPLFLSKTSQIVSGSLSHDMRNIVYSLALAAYCTLMFLGAPFWGDMSDRIGRKKVLLFCIFGTSLSLALSAFGIFIGSVATLILGRAAAGFFAGSLAVAQAAIVDISKRHDKIKNLSYISFAGCFGFSFGPTLGGLLAFPNLRHGIGLAIPFLGAALIAGLNGVGLAALFRETFHPRNKTGVKLSQGWNIFVSAFRNHKIRNLSCMFLLAEAGWSICFQFIPVYVFDLHHYTSLHIGYLMTFAGLIFSISLLGIMPILSKRLSTRHIKDYSLILTALGILLALFKSQLMLWISIIPIGLGGALFYVALLAMFSDAVDKNMQGWVMGVFAAVEAAAWSLGGLLVGILHLLGDAAPFITGAALVLASFLLGKYVYIKHE
ncbi:MAG: MFS transporter [Gammaproteobacteria bacterium]